MESRRDKDSVLPDGWLDGLFHRADLDASFRGLRRVSHFHAETMRGRIRSLQVRFEEADVHFAKALKKALKTERTIPNLVRQLVLNAYWFENRLLQGPIHGVESPREFRFPDFPEAIRKEYPEVEFVERLRLSAEALLRLHLGEFEISAKIYQDLVEKCRPECDDRLALQYLGLGASLHNLGQTEDALRNLENAGLCIQVGGPLLNRGRIAANLLAAYSCLEQMEMARDWRIFLENLDCPETTKEAMFKRSTLVVERWTRESRLLMA